MYVAENRAEYVDGQVMAAVVVDPVTVVDTSGNPAGSYATIQEAIDAASDGYTIRIAAGDYAVTEPLSITKSLTIIGANGGTDGNGTRGAESTLTAAAGVQLFELGDTALTVTFDGLKLVGSSILDEGVPGLDLTFTNSVFEVTTTGANVLYVGYGGGYEFTFTNNKATLTGGGYDFIDAFEYGEVNISGNSFTGVAAAYRAGTDNDVPLVININGSGTILDNDFTNIDIGVLVANRSGPLEIAENRFTDLHRVAGATVGGKAAGIVFFAPDYAGTIDIHDNSFTDADAGIRTSGVPGTALQGEPVTVDDNSFTSVTDPVLITIPGSLYATDSTVNGTLVESTYHGGPDANTFAGTALDDTVYGNGGTDTATYAAGATISRDASTGRWQVTDADSTDDLVGVERVTIGSDTYLLVDKAGSGVGGFQSIQAAVDAATGGETILIAPGSYTERSEYVPGDFQGLFINKPDLTLQGVEADGTVITDAATARTDGPVVISGAQNMFGANHWVGELGDGVTLRGLHLQAGASTTNKLLEIWGDGVTVDANVIDTFVGGDSAAPSWAAAIYLNEVAGQPISSYTISGNILNEGIYVANGVGDGASGDISAAQQITGNHFETSGFDAEDPATLGRYDMVAVQGRIPGLGYQDDPAQVPTISGNTRSDNSAPFIFRMTEEVASRFPTLAEVRQIVAANTDAGSTYAFVIDADTGEAKLVEADGINRLLLANGVETLNAFLDGSPDGVSGGARPTIEAGDTIVVQSGAGSVDSEIMVENLTVEASAASVDLDLILATTFADGGAIAGGGVSNVTLADYATGLGANVDVTGNALANAITGNSGDNVLAGEGGDDTLTGGAGDDTLQGGTGNDTAKYAGFVAISRTATGYEVLDGTDVDTLSGVEIVDDAVAGRTLLVGAGGFATIQEAVDAAVDGDTIVVSAGTYVEQVVVDGLSGVTIRAASGDTVTIKAPADVVETGRAINGREVHGVLTVLNSTNIIIEDIDVDGAAAGATVDEGTGAGQANFVGVFFRNASGTLDGVDVRGIREAYESGATAGGKPVLSGNQRGVGVQVDNDTLLAFTMTGGSISDFQKNATVFNRAILDVSGVTVTGGGAQTIIAQNGFQVTNSTGSISGNTVNAIGYAGPADAYSGAVLAFGNTDLAIDGNTITGANNETAAAKVVGIYVLDFGTANSGGSVQGNTISYVDWGIDVTGAFTPDAIVVADNSVTNVDLADPYAAGLYFAPNSDLTAPFAVEGTAQVDDISGAAGADTLDGLGGDDQLTGNGGNDVLDGGAGSDTATFAGDRDDATIGTSASSAGFVTGFTTVQSADGTDTLTGIEALQFDDVTLDLADPVQLFSGGELVGTFRGIQAAIDASSDGDTIRIAAGIHAGGFRLNKAVTIEGANAGIAGTVTRGAETIIQGTITVSAAAEVDGVRIVNATPDTFYFEGIRVTGANDFTVRNSVFYSVGVNASNGVGVGGDRALFLDTTTSGAIVFADNLVTGAAIGKGATASWSRGIWSDGANSSLTVSGSTFQYVRSGMNLDGFDSSKISVSNNVFTTVGTAVSLGLAVSSTISGFSANQFLNVDAEFNLRNIGSFTFDMAGAVSAVSGDGQVGAVYAYGGTGNDSLLGTQFDDILDDNAAGTPFNSDTTADTDTLDGRGGNDALTAGNGTDTLIGGAGNDSLTGGDGTDTAVFSGNRADYTASGATVIDGVAGRDGTDTLSGIELLQFADRTLSADAFFNNVAPVIGVLSNKTVAENAANGTVVGTVAATDANSGGGDGITYSLTDNAGGRFAIDAATGQITVANGALLDAEAAQQHSVTVVATDSGGLTDTEQFVIYVGDADEFDTSPVTDTNAAANTVAENVAVGTAVGLTARASDGDVTTNGITYSLTANPGGLFQIDAATGVVTTAAAIDFETAGASRSITVRATSQDGSFSEQAFGIAVTNVNEAPTITSDGGGASAGVSVEEDTLAVTTVQATDPDAGTTLTYTISGGADAAKFTINSTTGVLSFRVAPDFEAPTDAGGNNVYDVEVQASDGSLADTQAIAVTVVDQRETQTVILTNNADTYTAPSGDNYFVDGLAGNDTITTAGGRDIIRGNAGDDVISSGANDDVVTFSGAKDGFDTVDGGAGTNDRIHALAANTLIGLRSVTGVETISANGFAGVKIVGSALADSLDLSAVELVNIVSIDGAAGNDTIRGSQAGDIIIGGAGDDALFGNGGNDTFVLASKSGLDTIDGGAGVNTIRAGAANAVLTWSGITNIQAVSATAFDNPAVTYANFRIGGTSGNDRIDLTGVTLTDVAAIDGGSGNDEITGSAGNDTIIGGVGDDALAGGAGDDVFLVAARTGTDTVDGGIGYDVIRATAANVQIGWAAFTGVEEISAGGFTGVRLVGTAGEDDIDLSGYVVTGIDAIDGGSGEDEITGAASADRIIGGAGNDMLSGGGGNDTFLFAANAGIDTIDGGADFDTIQASAANAALAWGRFTNIEAISAGGFSGVRIVGSSVGDTIDLSALTLTGIGAIDGGSGNDTITGTDAADTIVGGVGNDTLNGGGGNDVFLFATGAGVDTIVGGAGTDTIRATAANTLITWGSFSEIEAVSGDNFTGVKIVGTTGADTIDLTGVTLTNIGAIEGGKGRDTITGSAGADRIVGGAGDDQLRGGGGADVFDFDLLADSSRTLFDAIFDFERGSDRIDVSTIDASTLAAGDQAFAFIGTAGFSGVAGQLRYETITGGGVQVLGDVDGNGTADFAVRLLGVTTLDGADFIL